MVEQAVMAEVGSGKMAMASSSTSNITIQSNTAPSFYCPYPSPLATCEEVVASPHIFKDTLEKLHAAMGTKFMIPIVGGRDLDLHRLFVEVTSRGGIAKVLQERKWKDVTGVFSFPSSATNASFILRKYYCSLLLHYEQIYFFKAKHWSPETIDPLQNTSRVTAVPRGCPQPVQSSPANSAPSAGSPVLGVIDGKFDAGYLITVKIGSEQFKGVLYLTSPDPTYQEQHQSSQQYLSASVNNSNQALAPRTARRRRRKKSEIRRRDPAHPKPNRSGYNFFFAEQHARLKPLYPGKDREISRMIGESWNKLKEPEKAIYQEKAVRDKERYQREMEKYKERLQTGQTSGSAMPVQQQPHEHNINVMVTDKKLLTDDANSHTPENETSSAKSEQSNLDLSTGQSITDTISLQLQPLQPDVNMTHLDNELQTKDANSPHMPESKRSPTKSDKSNLAPRIGEDITDAMPVQLQPHARGVSMMNLELELQTERANSPHIHTSQKEMISAEIEKSNLDLSTGQTIIDAVEVHLRPLGPDVNAMDLDKKLQTERAFSPPTSENETSSTKSEKGNIEPRTEWIIGDAPVQLQPLEHDVNMMDLDKELESETLNTPSTSYETSSSKSEKSNSDVNTRQLFSSTVQVQQKPHVPVVNMMDQDEKMQTGATPSVHEIDTSSNQTEKNNLIDHKTLGKDAEIKVSGGGATGVENTAKEIFAGEEANALRKRKDTDTDEDKLHATHNKVEIKKKRVSSDERISVTIQDSTLAPGEDREAGESKAEE